MPAFHAPTEARTRRAILLARFTFAGAYRMIGAPLDLSPDSHRCPSCRATGLVFTVPRYGSGRVKSTQNLTDATRCSCSACGLSTDAVGFIALRAGTHNPHRAMDEIEDWLVHDSGQLRVDG